MVFAGDRDGLHLPRAKRSPLRGGSRKVQLEAEIDALLQGSAIDSEPGLSGVENPEIVPHSATDLELRGAADVFVSFLRDRRAHYYPQGQPIGPKTKAFLARFFEPSLLSQVRVLKLTGGRVPNPTFYKAAKEMGFQNLPDLQHQASVTFIDAVVFNEKITERGLFHGLVHANQVQVLGVERYAELFVRGFLQTNSYFMIPIKAHAFALDYQFAENRERGFSVEAEIVRWLEQGRY